MLEIERKILSANKGGSGGVTYRVALPVHWIRKMGLGEDVKNLKLEFDGEVITIKNNEGEVKILERLLDLAKVEIEKEMDILGYIDDSDMHDRFLDELAKKLVEEEILQGNDDIELYYEKETEIEELTEELLGRMAEHMNKTYKRKGNCNERGDYTGCYYSTKEGLKKWSEFGE